MWGYCKELFWIGDIIVFIDTMTDYIWIYDFNNQNPIHIFTFYSKIKKVFQKVLTFYF